MWPARDVGRLAASCTLLLVLSGPILVPPVLYSAMAASAGVAQARVTALLPAAYAVGSLLTSVPGSLFMERFGLRCSFVLGAALQAVFATAQVASAQLWQLVALQAALGACHGFAGTVGFIAFCNAWFGDRPSTAIAIQFSAFGLAGVLWTPSAALLADRYGWQWALGAVAAMQWCVALPLAACCVHDPPPTARVRRPSSVAREPSADIAAEEEAGSRLPWWLTDASAWLLALLSASVLYVTYSVQNSVTLFLVDEAGMPLGHASLYTSLIFLSNMCGKLSSGPVYDGRYGRYGAAAACLLLLGGATLLLHLASSLASRTLVTGGGEALGFALIFGLGYGGCYALVQSKAALHFGHRRGFKTLQGFLFVWQMAGTILGELITPELAHHYSYTVAFGVVAAVAAVALLALLGFEHREARLGMKLGAGIKVPLV